MGAEGNKDLHCFTPWPIKNQEFYQRPWLRQILNNARTMQSSSEADASSPQVNEFWCLFEHYYWELNHISCPHKVVSTVKSSAYDEKITPESHLIQAAHMICYCSDSVWFDAEAARGVSLPACHPVVIANASDRKPYTCTRVMWSTGGDVARPPGVVAPAD